MRSIARSTTLLLASTLLFCDSGTETGGRAEAPPADAPSAEPGKEAPVTFDLTSSAFDDGDAIPARFGCDGEDASPPLSWSGAPDDAAAFALTVTDPDAPGGTFTHWVLYDVPGDATGLDEGAGAGGGPGVQGANDFDDTGYGGPCPPAGSTHRYAFDLYALDAGTGLDPGASRKDLEGAIDGHVLGTAELTGTFQR